MHDIRLFLPEVFEEPGTLLYIGARPDACSWLTELADAGNEITLLEVWSPNLAGFLGDPRISKRLFGSVVSTPLSETYDYVWWWHGPEHVAQEHFYPVIVYLRERTTCMIAVASPWGHYPQGSYAGNHHERHRWSVYEEDLHVFGFETKTDGQKDQPGSELVGRIRKEEI